MEGFGERPEVANAAAVGTSHRVGAIVTAAEEAAARLLADTEQRVHARIAEADRASTMRIEAAEAEALEILANARSEAARVEQTVRNALEAEREEATARALEIVARAGKQAKETRSAADAYAAQSREAAEARARELLVEAREVVAAVLADGGQLSDHLSALSQSLRANAERLLHDVRDAAGHLRTALDRVDVSDEPRRSTRPDRDEGIAPPELDVPEFIPGRR